MPAASPFPSSLRGARARWASRCTRHAGVALAIAGAGGCLGAATTSRPLTPSAVASASSSSAAGAPPAEPTTWVGPYASSFAAIPPAGSSGGPTRPCAPHVEWRGAPLPAGSGRQAGLGCSDFSPVRYPVCTPEQVARASRVDAVIIPGVAAPDIFQEGVNPPFSFRGYLRRNTHREGSDAWGIRIEAQGPDGACREMIVNDFPFGALGPIPVLDGRERRVLCLGDESVACCVSALVDSDAEIVYETSATRGQQACVIDARADQTRVRAASRADERHLPHPHAPSLVIP